MTSPTPEHAPSVRSPADGDDLAREESAADTARSDSEQGANDEVAAELQSAGRRLPGRRGTATRDRLLQATSGLLGNGAYRDMKVVDIARAAGTSPATFYQYFPDVESAILLLAEEAANDMQKLSRSIMFDWSADDAYVRVRLLVREYLDFWEQHRAVLRVLELATAEGDLRFHRMRTRTMSTVSAAFADAISAARHASLAPIEGDAFTVGSLFLSLLNHVASHQYGFQFWGIRASELIDTQAQILYRCVTGRLAPTEPTQTVTSQPRPSRRGLASHG